jgi:hypothetical protein
MLSVLDRTIVGSEGGVALTKITSSPKVLYWASDLAVGMLHQGFALSGTGRPVTAEPDARRPRSAPVRGDAGPRPEDRGGEHG